MMESLSNFAFNFNLRPYSAFADSGASTTVGMG
jgi:hypothetical protein